jgi:hypothetical protein
MHRNYSRTICGVLALAAALLTSQTGCTKYLFTLAYLIKGTDIAPEFTGLKDKRVAVVCRPLVELSYSASGVDKELASVVGALLKKKGKRVKIVDQRDVDDWVDGHELQDYAELGRAVEADMVLGIDLESFSLYRGQTLYQGKSVVKIGVYDISKDGEQVFEKRVKEVIFPIRGGRSTTDEPETQFRQEYVGVVAEAIGQHFYPHDPYSSFAKDSDVMSEE